MAKCCICNQHDLFVYGFDAKPVKDGLCCDACYARYVIPALNEQKKSKKENLKNSND